MVLPFRRRACQRVQRIPKVTLLAYLPDGSRQKEFFEGMDIDDWEIISFDPERREVCIVLLNDSQDVTVTVTIPTIILPSGDPV